MERYNRGSSPKENGEEIKTLDQLKKRGVMGWVLSRLIIQNPDLLNTTKLKNYLIVTKQHLKEYGHEFVGITSNIKGLHNVYRYDISNNKVFALKAQRERQLSRKSVLENKSMDIVLVDFNLAKHLENHETLSFLAGIAKDEGVIIFPTNLNGVISKINSILPPDFRRMDLNKVTERSGLKCVFLGLINRPGTATDIVVLAKPDSIYQESDGISRADRI